MIRIKELRQEPMSFSCAIRYLVRESGYTLDKLARDLEVTFDEITCMVFRNHTPDIDLIKSIAELFKIDVAWLLSKVVD